GSLKHHRQRELRQRPAERLRKRAERIRRAFVGIAKRIHVVRRQVVVVCLHLRGHFSKSSKRSARFLGMGQLRRQAMSVVARELMPPSLLRTISVARFFSRVQEFYSCPINKTIMALPARRVQARAGR